MQHGLTETSNRDSPDLSQTFPPPISQHGFPLAQPSSPDLRRSPRSCSTSSGSRYDFSEAGELDDGLDRLSISGGPALSASRAGQRILEYENGSRGSVPRKSPRPPLAFQVVKRPGSASDGVQLTDFPNEILTQILSHLHPDSHAAVALVSKRFYALVTTPYAWRTAFLRYFPGHDALSVRKKADDDAETADAIRTEFRSFTRLSSLASWRSEYLLRTRLLRSLGRGKPGNGGVAPRSGQSGKKDGAVLTYNSKLPWMVTNIHASFVGGKKGPRAIHGAADLCISTVSDPTTGRIEKAGLDDPFAFAQLEDMVPNLEPFGVGDGPAAVPNVMDVSQPYGMVGGEGFPGGRVYFRASGELRGRYLSQDNAVIDMMPEIPKLPELVEAISSVWIAKSTNVPFMTQSMVGILAGSTLGVVTSYALRCDSTGPRFSNGDMTARWILSPGVPIIDIKVDDSYNQKRKANGRVWAVALNALGEVFYLTSTPTAPLARAKAENTIKEAWSAGRTAYWELIGQTRRTAHEDEFDKNVVRGAYSPRSPCDAMNLSKEQTIAEAQEIEKFMRYNPSYFRTVCNGWDMRRNLEVDFAGGDEARGGEGIVVVTCGHEKGELASMHRFTRSSMAGDAMPEEALTPADQDLPTPTPTTSASIFGGPAPISTETIPQQAEVTTKPAPVSAGLCEEWRESVLSLKHLAGAEITTSAIDLSTYALLTASEDPLHSGTLGAESATPGTPTSRHATGEIPGRRARLLAVGTNSGMVIAWNMRDVSVGGSVSPVRVIQTESPEISCIAVSALYLAHGGTDGLVQAWDPLASTTEPVRTLSAKSSGRIPRNILHAMPELEQGSYFAVRAIFLDPDPTSLRGMLAYGTFLRFWTYSSSGQSSGKKRRGRHSDVNGRVANRRHGGAMSEYIASEEAELRHEQANRSRELARLRSRFGVGLGDLTDEEAVRYAQMISEEAFQMEEQRRLSASDTGSAADIGETASSTGSIDTVTPEPSLSGVSPSGSGLPPLREETDDDYEAQIQRAIRLSLLEGVNGAGESPRGQSSTEYEFQVKIKTKERKKGKGSSSASPSTSTPVVTYGESSRAPPAYTPDVGQDMDEDLALALRLSLEEEEARQKRTSQASAFVGEVEEYPALEVKGKGKGKQL
ncbi:F-box/WD repeat-containing protein pof10 [Podospora conica]|nr:F-box/WD repeat-containing protein pof10 [Schizothecium conicum]